MPFVRHKSSHNLHRLPLASAGIDLMRPVTSAQYPLWSQYRGTNSGGSLQRLLFYFIVLARMLSMKYWKTSVFMWVTLGWEVTPLTNWETFDGAFVGYEWVKSFGGYGKCQMMQCHKRIYKSTSGLVSIPNAYMSGSPFQSSHITLYVCSIQP